MAPTPDQSKRLKAKNLVGKKQPNARVQRYLKSTESQLVERRKATLLLKGVACSNHMSLLLKELRSLQAPASKLLSKKNQIVPLEDASSLEFLTTKNDCHLLALASHNKKRPHNLVLGRTFDHAILDLAELGVIRYKSSIHDYPGSVPKKRVGSKPMLLFCGDAWNNGDFAKLQNLLIDFYRGDVVDKLVPSGLDHIIVFTLSTLPQSADVANNPNLYHKNANNANRIIHQRTYFCQLKKDPHNASSKIPVPYLQPCGPDLDMVVRRTQWADADLAAAARRLPHSLQTQRGRRRKNQTTTVFGETVGRLHLSKQNVDQMGGRKIKALRRHERMEQKAEQEAIEQDLEREEQT
mmetsp:Transcript_2089/g.4217  ORF Transcript_2089/g.4217 Transcript_2089/m.4217 type:complete len:352 (+) Transcript_2089:432-1487(+)